VTRGFDTSYYQIDEESLKNANKYAMTPLTLLVVPAVEEPTL